MSTPFKNLHEAKVLHVKPGQGLHHINAWLKEEGLIETRLWLRVHARVFADSLHIKRGEYWVRPGDSPNTLLDKLSRGDVIQHAIVVVEGSQFREILKQLNASPFLQPISEDELENIRQSLIADYDFEGWFFPDTYYVTRGTKVAELIARGINRMKSVLNEEWQNRESGLPLKSPYEALILASIVEKETGLPEERDMVAGVFIRRLQKGMRLQTDPTVIYGIGEAFDGNIKRFHLKQKTPYNTYVIRGLPPTPIASPGREAIHATLHPDDSQNLYFVATGDGGHYFSETLQQHRAAVRRYQLKKK